MSRSSSSLFDRFLHSQSTGAIVLVLATLAAVIWANSPWAELYQKISHLEIGFTFQQSRHVLALDHWVKDGLMAIFFFVVGLEIKRELIIGELSSIKQALLPVTAAVGGAIAPALIYYGLNPAGDSAAGWGVPMATDIAFALGILALFGKRVPLGLKVFLTALAIVDDLLAVLVIALFYTSNLKIVPLIVAAVLLLFLFFLIRGKNKYPALTFLLIIGVWFCVFLSGIHATVAGVLLAMVVPVEAMIEPAAFMATLKKHKAWLKTSNLTRHSMVNNKKQLRAIQEIYEAAERMLPAGYLLEKHLHTFQAFIILPLFALFAAGIEIDTSSLGAATGRVGLGIVAGLVMGKQIGIFGGCLLAVKSRLADLPKGVEWRQIWGVSLLGGIGFTMSIFISELAFTDGDLITEAKLAIFIASILAAILGSMVLAWGLPKRSRGQ